MNVVKLTDKFFCTKILSDIKIVTYALSSHQNDKKTTTTKKKNRGKTKANISERQDFPGERVK